MAILLNESFNIKSEKVSKATKDSNINSKDTKIQESFKEVINSNECISDDSIMQLIEGIHVGPTRNYTWYTEEALKDSVPYWTTPYQRPVIMHHNDEDGKIIGRVHEVDYVENFTLSGTPALRFNCNIPDKEGIEQILDGRLHTVSVSAIAKDARCSICNKPIQLDEYGDEVCGHNKGYIYDGKTAYWMIYKMEPKEISYVIVPSDVYAQNIRTVRRVKDSDVCVAEQNKIEGNVNLMESVLDKDKETTIEDPKEPVVTETPVEKTVETPLETEKEAEGTVATEEPVVKETETPVEEPVDQVATLTAKVEELTKQVAELTAAKQVAEDAHVAVKESLDKELKLKKDLENEVLSTLTELKESKFTNINALRSVLGRPQLDVATLKERSMESLNDSILDLKEELNSKNINIDLKESLKKIEVPEIKGEKIKENSKDVVIKESNTSNINFEKEISNIISDLLN